MLTRRSRVRVLFALVVASVVVSFLGNGLWWSLGLALLLGLGLLALPYAAIPSPADAAKSLDFLALTMYRRWRMELEHGGVYDPRLLDVTFRASDASLSDHWANISRSSDARNVRPAGRADEIAEVYRRTPSRRLVILGNPGSGKSTAAMLIALDMLEQRGSDEPIPVILHAASWNPDTTRFPDWFARRLEADYPGLLARAASGRTLAERLIYEGRLLPIVDGLDELAEPLRVGAVRSLEASQGAFILLCRSMEYAQLVEDFGVLRRAAVIQLTPLPLSSVVEYLVRTAPRHRQAEVLSLIDTVRSTQASPLAGALNSPLMVRLLASAYLDSGNDPRELLDRQRFPAAEFVQDRLLEMLVASRGRRFSRHDRIRFDDEHTRRWLTFLARRMTAEFRTGFHWWDLERSVPRAVPAAAGALAVAFAVTVVAGFVDMFLGVAAGAVSGVLAYLTGRLIIARWGSVDIRGPAYLTSVVAIRAVAFGTVGAIPMALVAAQAVGWQGGVATGGALLLVLSANVWLSHGSTSPVAGPVATVRASRRCALVRWSALGLTVSLTLGFLGYRLSGNSAYASLAAGMGLAPTLLWLVVGSAWGRFCVVRVWLAVRNLVPLRLFTFLEAMREIGLISVDGPAYRFKYPRLRDVLASSGVRGVG